MDKTLLKVLLAAMLVFVGIAGLGVGTALFIRSKMRAAEAQVASDDGPSSGGPSNGPSRAGGTRAAGGSDTDGPLQVKNGEHADLTEMLGFARTKAAEKRAGAKLVGINAFGLHHGTADLDHRVDTAYFIYEFEFIGFDKSKPPGQDKIEETISVDVRGHDATVSVSPMAMHLKTPDVFGGELPPPGCPSKKAFEAAVASGVPDNAIARISYESEHGTKRTTWTIWVDGHDDYRRVVDATTCTIAKKDGAGPEAAEKGHRGHKHR
jgi:hypothetical protein